MYWFSLSPVPGGLFSLEGPNQSLSAPFDLCQIFWVYFWLLWGYYKRGAPDQCCYSMLEHALWEP